MPQAGRPSVDSLITHIAHDSWEGPCAPEVSARAAGLLESGCVLYFPQLQFPLEERERSLLCPDICDGKSKNVSLNPHTGEVRGAARLEAGALENLREMMARFAGKAQALARGILPAYRSSLECGPVSFRPTEIAGRKTSLRKDDTRLHVDAFPSRPMQGRRILRVFANVGDEARVWRLGAPFQDVVENFARSLRMPFPASAWFLQHLGIVKGHRTAYDHLMLQLHNRMKADTGYQARALREEFAFPPGATWMVFTDQVSHAARAGRYALEQTFLVSVAALEEPSLAPLRVLEARFRRKLT